MMKIIKGTVRLQELYLKDLPNMADMSIEAGTNTETNETTSGAFVCSKNNLKSLKGAPKVEGGFYCSSNNLSGVVGVQDTINGNFDVSFNPLETLEGFPKRVNGDVYAQECGFNEEAIRKVCEVTGDVYQ